MFKKIFLFFILSVVNTYAFNPADYLEPIPDDFKPECFKYYKKIEMKDIFWWGNSKKYLVNKDDLFITHYGFIMPYKRIDSSSIAIRRFYDSYVELYSGYDCKESFTAEAKPYNNFKILKTDKEINAFLEENPKYKIYLKKDFDNDWVEDSEDNCPYRYNPDQKDTNKDNSWDICMDDDSDGVIWVYDTCPNIFNPAGEYICNEDTDEDNILDINDNCINIKNSDQKDSDKDWVWDACDNCKNFNPAQADKNKDWVWDACEDTDNDSIIDWVDNCINIKNSNQEDIDEDWVWDICDNCKNISNSNQKDDNKDSIWDVCEDLDGDKISLVIDNCPNDKNPDQEDIDEDGIWDICDDKDNRFKESNKELYLFILFIVSIVFSSIIFSFKRWK